MPLHVSRGWPFIPSPVPAGGGGPAESGPLFGSEGGTWELQFPGRGVRAGAGGPDAPLRGGRRRRRGARQQRRGTTSPVGIPGSAVDAPRGLLGVGPWACPRGRPAAPAAASRTRRSASRAGNLEPGHRARRRAKVAGSLSAMPTARPPPAPQPPPPTAAATPAVHGVPPRMHRTRAPWGALREAARQLCPSSEEAAGVCAGGPMWQQQHSQYGQQSQSAHDGRRFPQAQGEVLRAVGGDSAGAVGGRDGQRG